MFVLVADIVEVQGSKHVNAWTRGHRYVQRSLLLATGVTSDISGQCRSVDSAVVARHVKGIADASGGFRGKVQLARSITATATSAYF